MILLGNDIVDLNAARQQNNWRRKGYLEKIFTSEEQSMIHTASDKHRIVWLLWSMKEAAYKIINRDLKKRFYSPKSLRCKLINTGKVHTNGEVLYKDRVLVTQSITTAAYVHTLATNTLENFSKTQLIIKVNPDYFKKTYNSNFKVFKDENGFPYLLDGKSKQQKLATLSHHGNYSCLATT